AIGHGSWSTPAGERLELRLRTIFDGVARLIAEHAPDAVALEESFVGVDARTALSVGQARGAVLVAAALQGVECTEYAPARVKQAVCGYGRAEKAQVQRMVKAILGLQALPTPNHAADALAVAIVSGSPAEELRRAIVREDAARFQAIPGIGKKTAERIVLELKEKLATTPISPVAAAEVDDHVVARNALVELGYSLTDAERALAETDADAAPEERVRQALRRAA